MKPTNFAAGAAAVLLLQLALAPCHKLAAQQADNELALPIPGDDRLICGYEPGGVGGQSSFGWVLDDHTDAAFLPHRFNGTRTGRFQPLDRGLPDANRDGQLSRIELATLDNNRRIGLLRQYDSNADDQLSRYELLQNLPDSDRESAQQNSSVPQPTSPSSRKPFENLRRFGLPTTRSASVRSRPFARAATFGTVSGFTQPRSARASAPSCRSPQIIVYLRFGSR